MMLLNMVLNNPLEQFEIFDFVYLLAPIFGFTKLSLTNIGFYLILVVFLILAMILLANNNRVIPTRWSISQESIFGSILSLVHSQMGQKHEVYVPLIYAIFILVLVSNLVGLVPYSFTVTSQFVLPISLSVTILIGVTIIGFQQHGIGFFAFFIPAGTPLFLVPLLVLIEVVSYLARGLTLGLRLAANMMAGHLILHFISLFAFYLLTTSFFLFLLSPLGILTLIIFCGLELFVAILQAYIFTLLTCSYIKDAISLH